MSVRKLAMVAALGASLASAPVVAQSTQASSLSVASAARSGAGMEDSSLQSDRGRERGRAFGRGFGSQTYIIGFFVIVVIALGLYFAFDDDEGTISV